MDRSTFLMSDVIDLLEGVASRRKVNDHGETDYNEEAFNDAYAKHGIDRATVDKVDEIRNGYVGAIATDFGEQSNIAFKEDENLVERKAKAYIGKYDTLNLLATRDFDKGNGDVVKNNLLVEHNRKNNHLEGVQAWVSALADL